MPTAHMKGAIEMRKQGPGRVPAAGWRTAGIGALALLGACVSQKRYDDTLATSKLYQRMYADSEAYQGQLEAELDTLRAQVALRGEAVPVDAGYTQALDARLADLKQMEERLRGMSDTEGVTVFSFDGGYGYRLEDSVVFDSGSADVSPNGRRLLDELAKQIRARAYGRVWVRGHTDTDPIVKPATKERFPHGNLQLSAARAVEVAALLVGTGGVDGKRLAVAGFGPNEPVVANDSAANKQKNRRVEVYVEDAQGQGGR